MLHFITDAPRFVVDAVVALARAFSEPAPEDAPAWAVAAVHVKDEDAMLVLTGLREWRVEGRKPAKAAIADPVGVMAAAKIDRERGGSTPAQQQLWI